MVEYIKIKIKEIKMGKLGTLVRRVAGGSFKRMNNQIQLVHDETGKNRVGLFFDMMWCIFRYSVGYQDYRVFGFAGIHGKKRRTFMTMNDNLFISHKLNDKEYFHYFDNKFEFNEQFREYVGRDFTDLRKCGEDGLRKFCEGKKTVFAKALNSFGGEGITREVIDENTDFSALYKKLTDNSQFLVEDEIKQHEKMSSLSPSSINTLRIVTVNYKGEVHLMYTLMRIGNGKTCVDNICSGGMYVRVGDDGIVHKPAFCEKEGKYFEAHPATGTEFCGFEVPMFAEAVELCKKAAQKFPQVGYVGWDVAITPDKPVIVEGNTLPGYDMVQNRGHIDDNVGILPKFREVLGEDFFNKKG